MRGRTSLASIALALAITASAAATAFAGNKSGFRTTQHSMLDPVMPGVGVTPLMTVGDTLSSGFRFEAIPDGISLRTRGKGRVDLFVNHETGKVPFPFVRANPNETNGENDFDNAQVSRLRLNQHSAGVLGGSFAIASSSGYQRFCSNYLATSKEGFNREILFTNEESPDYVFRQEDSWPPPIGDPAEREAGLVVALDVKSRKHHPIQGMGRHNHENTVPIPGYGKPVVLSGDDTFTSGPLTGVTSTPASLPSRSSTPTSHRAPRACWPTRATCGPSSRTRRGSRTTTTSFPASGPPVTGHFIKVPRNIATGLNPDGSELQSEDIGYPTRRTTGAGRPTSAPSLRSASTAPSGCSSIGATSTTCSSSCASRTSRTTSGPVRATSCTSPTRAGAGPGPGLRAGQPFRSTNGRVWKMVLDPNDPTRVTSLTVFVEGDDNPVKTQNEIHQPDNLESTRNGILVTEDPGSSQQFSFSSSGAPPSEPNATTARLWHVPLAGDEGKSVVARVNQSADGGPTDVDGRPPGNWGAWESTGIVDASKAFGRDMFLINIQAHTLWIEKAPGDDNYAPAGPDFTYKREGGQLLLIKIPGG